MITRSELTQARKIFARLRKHEDTSKIATKAELIIVRNFLENLESKISNLNKNPDLVREELKLLLDKVNEQLMATK